MSAIKHYRELNVYQGAMDWTMRIFVLTKSFPGEEKYSLTDQIRRSSRSVCTNLAEAWRKRRYQAAFVSKLSDAETEAAETQVHAEIAWRSAYITEAQFHEIDDAYDHIMGQIVKMADQPEKWLIRPQAAAPVNRRTGGSATSAASDSTNCASPSPSRPPSHPQRS